MELPTQQHGRASKLIGRAWKRQELLVFALATLMLFSAAVSSYFLIRSQPALSAPVSRVLGKIELKALKDWYCDKVLTKLQNATSLQRFLSLHHTKLDDGDIREVPHHPGSIGRDNEAANHKAACACDCSVDVAAALAAQKCPTDCSQCGGTGDGAAAASSGGSSAVAAALSSGNLKSLSGPELLEAIGRDVRQRFTDVTCYLHGDESELCAYHNAICYDGQNVVLSVPVPPAPHKSDPAGLGLVLGDPTGACYDYRCVTRGAEVLS